jgi:hypothetical protein
MTQQTKRWVIGLLLLGGFLYWNAQQHPSPDDQGPPSGCYQTYDRVGYLDC